MHGFDVSVAERVACQLPLKDNAFSTFLDQNPLFELRPEIGVSLPAKACSADGDRQQRSREARPLSAYLDTPLSGPWDNSGLGPKQLPGVLVENAGQLLLR
jgi:hypothetical protein